MSDAATAIQEFKATVTLNLLAPDDFIDWNAVTTAVEASKEAARWLDALRSKSGLNEHSLADALKAHPALYDAALSLVAFNTSGSQVIKWGLPAEVPTEPQGRLRTAQQLLYVGLNRVLAGSAPAIDLLRVAEVYKDSFRRRFRSGNRLEAEVKTLVRRATVQAAKRLDVPLRLVTDTVLDQMLRRSAEYVIAAGNRPVAAISTVFQNQSGGRQQRDLSVTYPLLQERFTKHGVALILIADGQGLLDASERTLALLFAGVRFPMSMRQASEGALEEALVLVGSEPPPSSIDSDAVARLISEALGARPNVAASELPVARDPAVLALAKYAEANKRLDLALSSDGETLGWRSAKAVSAARSLQTFFDPRRALDLFAERVGAETTQISSDSSGIRATLPVPEVPPFTGKLVASASRSQATPELARSIGLRAIEDAPGSSIAVLLSPRDLSEQELDAHRKRQVVLPANLVVVGPRLLDDMAKARFPLDTLVRAVLNQSDLTKVSPFILSNATPERMFYGREGEAATILNTLGTNSVALLGSRRIGKTSLLRRVRDQLIEANFLPFFGDCQTVRTWADFAQLAATEWGVETPHDFRPGHLANVVHALEAGTGKQVVILLDEVDQLLDWDRAHSEDSVPEAFFRACRSLSQDGTAQFVFSGERQIAQRIWDPQSPHWNFCRPLPLAQLTRDAATALLVRPLRAMNIAIQDEDAFRDEVWLRTSGHPQIAQTIGDKLVRRLDERRDRRRLSLTVDDVRAVCDTYAFAEHYLNTYWGQATALEREVSAAIAQAPATLAELRVRLSAQSKGANAGGKELEAALRMLQLYGILEEHEGRFQLRATWFSQALTHFDSSGTSTILQ